MIEIFVKRPAMTVMFVLVFVVMGIVSYTNLTIERFPKVEFPMVSIKVLYPGASPLEVESQIIKKLEDAVAEISEVNRMKSWAYENFAFTMLEFNIGADVNVKSAEVKDKVEIILNDLPDGAEKPEVAKFDPLVQPIMELVLTSNKHDGRELFEYADKSLKKRLSVIAGVASIDLTGGKKRQINVMLDPLLMKKHFISINDVIGAIGTKNVTIPAGNLLGKSQELGVRVVGEFQSPEDLRNMTIVTRENERIKLSQIATVRDSFKRLESISRFNGEDSVGLSLKKLSDGDAISIAKKLQKILPDLKKTLPEGMTLTLAFDSTESILSDNRDTAINILIGIVLTIAILFLFIGDLRFTFIAAVVIPTSLISTLLPMDFSGFSINFMTLLAMATSLGTLIANAIVILDAVAIQMEKGKERVQAAIDGTKDVAVAVFAAAGTNVVVFTPLAFMQGIVGQFMFQFGLTVVYATLFSLLASFTLTPMLCSLMLGDPQKRSIFRVRSVQWLSEKFNSFLVKEYGFIFRFSIKYWFIFLPLVFAGMYMSLIPAKYIGMEFFSKSDQNLVIINADLPNGTPLEENLEVTKEIEKLIEDIPERKSYISFIGGSDGSHHTKIIINLKNLKDRARSDTDIIAELMPKLSKIPDLEFGMSREQGGATNSDVTLNISGENYDKMVEITESVKKIMIKTGNFRSITSTHRDPKPELRFFPDENKMIRFDVNNAVVGGAIRSAIAGNDSNIYREKGEEYKINIEISDEYKTTPADLEKIGITSNRGLLPISGLGRIEKAPSSPKLYRRDKKRVIQLGGFLSKGSSDTIRFDLEEKLQKMDWPDGYGYKFTGEAEYSDESTVEISKAGLLAIVLTYMLLVAILNSFVHPFSIVAAVAPSFLGVILFLFFTQSTINIGSQMAFVMLIGLVVNNAILVIDFALQRIGEGVPAKEALWTGAGYRFRTILMTSLAIIAGAFPQLFDPMNVKSAMGAVIIGGMIGSIVFTFLLVPIVFLVLEWMRRQTSKLMKKMS